MYFHSLTRRELQSLCKLNKIPANLTNVAMADALQSLEIVEGIEEFLKVSQSETADLGESVKKVEVSSPKAPQTRCRTSNRQRVKTTENETLPPTVTRTTRWGSKQLPIEVEESLKTPAVSRTSRKDPATSSRRNVSNQLNECENEAKEEGLVDNKYSTRRSTRLTEKKSAVTKVKKGIEKAVKIDSFLDQENVIETGNSNAEVEDICNAFENLDVVVMEEDATHKSVEEDEDCGDAFENLNNLKPQSDERTTSWDDTLKISEVKMDCVEEDEDCGDAFENLNNLKPQSDERTTSWDDTLKISEVKMDEVYDVKPESDEISNPSEEAATQRSDEVSNQKQESHETSNSCEEEKISEMKIDEVYDVKPESDGISIAAEEANNKSEDEDLEDDLKISEVKIDEVYDVKPDSDDISSPCEDENLEQKPDLEDNFMNAMKEHNLDVVQEVHADSDGISEMKNEVSEINESSTMVSRMIIDNTETPIDETATKEMEEDMSELDDTMTEEVEELKADLFAENNANEKSDADSGLTQNPLILSDVTGHPTHVKLIKKAIPFKNMSSVVSDDKENIVVDEGKNRKEEKMSFNEISISIRQLRKQLKKALTLKNLNEEEEVATATTRPALQALCENQMVVGGETEN
ncbi:hypothetical protein L1987_37948 [Smallanthus sonchifolius]|uniref:Uncharacterized protein n=1 Tax=Smallanthus sonchifolius TaxID=185202 RepID=A0ACB9HKC0_9ASTR|nr:hypothetical protein L1987_37948 [Smallanthus sonchifolius]